MDELLIIFGFIIIATLIVFGSAITIHKSQIAYRERREAFDRESASVNPAGAAKKIEKLEERVRVLERLATDRERDLAAQIEDLRGFPDADLMPTNREKVQ